MVLRGQVTCLLFSCPLLGWLCKDAMLTYHLQLLPQHILLYTIINMPQTWRGPTALAAVIAATWLPVATALDLTYCATNNTATMENCRWKKEPRQTHVLASPC